MTQVLPQLDRSGGEELRRFMRHWPTGVTVVTTLDRGVPMGCTVNAMMSGSLSPPLLVVALGQASATLGAIRRTGAFGLNVLAADQRQLCQRFACGSQDERFRGLRYRMRRRLPVLFDVVTASVCAVRDTVPCGDHVLVFGEPEWFPTEDPDDSSPLIFHRRGFHELARTDDRKPA